MALQQIRISTGAPQQLKDITAEVNAALASLGIDSGICHIFVPHTTAGLVVNENADPDVCRDMLDWLDDMVPQSRPFRHVEGNSSAHIKATLVGQSAALPVQGGRLALGTWQGVFFAEFDGPRQRTVIMTAAESLA